MAGDWIKMRTDLPEDPAVIVMAERLGLDEFSIVGRLHSFWAWIDRQSRDGHATGVTHVWLDRHVRCDGFAAALVSVGWLTVTATGLQVPNFDRHNGETAKNRALTTIRKQRQRSRNVTQESRPERDESVTREEKRREEKKETPPCGPPAVEPPLPGTRKGARETGGLREVSEDFTPSSDDREWARTARRLSDEEIDFETEKFVRHHRAKGSKFKRPDLAWRNWIAGRFIGRTATKGTGNDRGGKRPISYASAE